MTQTSGHLYGAHRVLLPDDTLPLYAALLDNTSPPCRNELLVQVHRISLHPTFVRKIFAEAHNDPALVPKALEDRVTRHGKLSSGGEPVGYAIGETIDIGEEFHPILGLLPAVTGNILILSDLAALPLFIESFDSFNFDSCVVDLHATTYLSPSIPFLPFDSVTYGTLGEGGSFLPLRFSPLRKIIERTVPAANRILIVGSSRDALLCAAMVRKTHAFSSIYGFDTHVGNLAGMRRDKVYDMIAMGEVCDAVTSLDATLKMTGDELVDIVIDATFEQHNALSAILPLRDGGTLISANNTPSQEYIRAAHSISRNIEALSPTSPLLTESSYQKEYDYFSTLIQRFPSLLATI